MRLLAAIMIMMVSPAYGHDFYDFNCCDDKDCHPVERGMVVFGFLDGASGYYINDRQPGITEFFPEIENDKPNTRIFLSQDFQNHICRPQSGGQDYGGRISTRCIYVAPSSG